MKCPICRQELIQKSSVLICPINHGALVSGKFLHDIEESTLNDATPSYRDNNKLLACPNCSHEMHKVNYTNKGIFIDSCPNCHYRWLDKGEISKINNFKPKLNPEDVLLLDKLTQTKEPIKEEDVNPKIPGFNLIRSTAAIGTVLGNKAHNNYTALTTMGLYGIIVGLVKSKFLRIVIPLMFAIFGLVVYLIFKAYK